ncbi:MAG TPA: hypothetical protein VFV46_06430 [Lacibacter sp.]|nr:hypothetical protein [Lacibacter sp.]
MKAQQIEEQLWSYIDGSVSAAEKVFVEKMLAANDEWKAKYREQLELHRLLSEDTELEQPSLRFTKNVMDGIAELQPKAATSSYINKTIIRSIAAFFIITIAGLLIYALLQADWSTNPGSADVFSIDTPEFTLPQFKMPKILNTTMINMGIMITVILGLMVFDGFLRRKKSAL